MAPWCVLVQAPLEPHDVPRIAETVDCFINSANNHLLTPGVSGIAGALLAVGGEALLAASDAAKAAAGGEVAVGSAVATAGGALPCGVVHAVAMAYRSHDDPQREAQGRRVLATADTVSAALTAAILAACEQGWRTAATKIMCARAGYSIYGTEEAPLIMLEAMRAAVAALPDDCPFERLLVFVPEETLQLTGVPPYLEPVATLSSAATPAGDALVPQEATVGGSGTLFRRPGAPQPEPDPEPE